MPISPQMMRILIGLCLLGMALLAVLSLRKREMPTAAYILWGLLAVFLPLIGPFLVLFIRPGVSRQAAPR